MRTTLFLVAGFLVLGGAFIVAKQFAGSYPAATTVATVVFIIFWLVVAGFNMWTGVAKAGYSAGEELPIFLLIFGAPAIVALLLKWKVL